MRILISFVVCLMVMFGAIGFFQYTNTQHHKLNREMANVNQAMECLQRIVLQTDKLAASYRGYAVTLAPSHLQAARQAMAELGNGIASLKKLEHNAFPGPCDSLCQVVEKFQGFAKGVMDFSVRGDREGAIRTIAGNQGERLRQVISRTVNRLEAEGRHLLRTLEGQQQALNKRASITTYAVAAFSLAVLALVFSLLHSAFRQRKEAELALNRLNSHLVDRIKAATSQLEMVLNRITDGVVSLDAEWRYTFLNDAALATHPMGREGAVGKSLWVVHPDVERSPFGEKFREAMATQTECQLESYYEPLKKWLDVRFYPSPDGLTIYYRDSTAQKGAEMALLESRGRLNAILENTTDLIWSVDSGFRLLFCNSPFKNFIHRLTGREMQLGDDLRSFLPPAQQAELLKDCKQAFDGRYFSVERDIEIGGKRVCFEHHFNPIKGANGAVEGISVFMKDITDRIEAQQQLHTERQWSETIVNSQPGIVYLYTKTGRFIRWNKNFESVSGYSASEIAAMKPLDFFDAGERELLQKKIANVFISGSDEVDAHLLTKSGNKIPYYFNGRRVSIGGEEFLVGAGLDITRRKMAEEELLRSRSALRHLASHLQNVREDERRGIAREIHDELGQQMTGLKMDTVWLGRNGLANSKQAKERLETMLSLIDESIKTVRKISSQLRPGVLEDFGLLSAMEGLHNGFVKRMDLKSTFISTIDSIEGELNQLIGVYRIYQECLNNIAKHAQATTVSTNITIENDQLVLRISDNGRGFDPLDAEGKSLGITGMKERALMLGGELHIRSAKGSGTTVTLQMPTENLKVTTA